MLWDYSAQGTRPFIVQSQDASLVAIETFNKVHVRNALTGEVVGATITWEDFRKATFVDNERLLLVGPSEIRIYDISTGQQLHGAKFKNLVYGLRVHRDRLVMGLGNREILCLKVDDLSVVWANKAGIAFDIAISPSGKLVACSGQEGASVYNLATGKLVVHLLEKEMIQCLSFSPRGQFLAVGYGRGRNSKTALNVFHTKNWKSMGHDCPHDWQSPPTWTADESRFLLGAGHKLTVWATQHPRILHEYETEKRVKQAILSANGKWILSSFLNSDCRLVDTLSGESLGTFEGEVASVRFAPSSREFFLTRAAQRGSFQAWSLFGKSRAEKELQRGLGEAPWQQP